ncbi:MAG: tyrosine-type recombinase/integrase [Bacteroidota bacterium]
MNQNTQRSITLKHVVIDEEKMIGIQFHPDKLIQALIKQLPSPRWSSRYRMVVLPNTRNNLNTVFGLFKGVAWVNTHYFFSNRPLHQGSEPLCIDQFRNRNLPSTYVPCPESYLQKLEIRKYALSTARTYIALFEKFLNHFPNQSVSQLSDREVREYLQNLVSQKKSDSYLNSSINAIKFYYEVVLGMPNTFYEIERPIRKEPLPKVIGKAEVLRMIRMTSNLKHKCMISLLYSAGLRRQELLNLEISDINSDRMCVMVRQGKGKKDRITLLSKSALEDLRAYYIAYKPNKFLFEGEEGGAYSGTSLANVVRKAALRAGIRSKVTPHVLRHSFATHLLESGTDLRYIQALLGHNSSRTTEIYTHVATHVFKQIKNPLDLE